MIWSLVKSLSCNSEQSGKSEKPNLVQADRTLNMVSNDSTHTDHFQVAVGFATSLRQVAFRADRVFDVQPSVRVPDGEVHQVVDNADDTIETLLEHAG